MLGSILFSIFVNNLGENVHGIQLYADYAVLFSRDPNVLQLNLDKICTWCDDNLLKLNVKKSKWMMIGQYRHSMADEVIIYLKDTRMERVKIFNYLGLTIDTNYCIY